jgi:hypothetical protein
MRAAGTQEFVAPWRSVSANNVDLTAGIVQGRDQVVEQVEQVRIEVTYLSSTMVAESSASASVCNFSIIAKGRAVFDATWAFLDAVGPETRIKELLQTG